MTAAAPPPPDLLEEPAPGGDPAGARPEPESAAGPAADAVTVIRPPGAWPVPDLGELWRHRDLLALLTLRSVAVRYRQSVLGVGWAVVRPVASVLIFTLIFGGAAGFAEDVDVPYPLFAYLGLLPWNFFAAALAGTTGSVVSGGDMLTKVYFPRLVLPLSAVAGQFPVFLAIGAMTGLFMLWYGYAPTVYMLALPLLLLIVLATAVGASCWATALSVQFRDINHGSQFAIRMLMYSGPVVYPLTVVDARWHRLWAVNPMVGVCEGFRAACGVRADMPWDLVGVGAAVSLAMLVSGVLFFVRRERLFADVA